MRPKYIPKIAALSEDLQMLFGHPHGRSVLWGQRLVGAYGVAHVLLHTTRTFGRAVTEIRQRPNHAFWSSPRPPGRHDVAELQGQAKK